MALTMAALVSLASASEPTTQAHTNVSAAASSPPHYPAAPPDARITDLGWFAPTPKPAHRATRPDRVELAYVIPIHGQITPSTFDIIRRKLTARPAAMVIFDIKTPGGRVDVTEEIIQFIQRDHFLQNDLNEIYTVAYVNPRAISAGAIIAMACNEIVMAPGGLIGDATPIFAGAGGVQSMDKDTRAKMHSYVQAVAVSVAGQSGHDPLLAKCMISMEFTAWLVRNRDTMELRIVSPDEFHEPIANIPPAVHPTTAPAITTGSAEWEFLRVIDGPDTVLTLQADEAEFLGLSSATLMSMNDVKAHFNIQNIQVLENNWSESMVEFLTSPAVTGILAFVLIMGVYAFTHTGSVTSAIMIVLSLALLLGARYLTGLALWWEILVLAVGIVLLLLEIFILPGFGVAGILGIVMILVGLLLTLVPYVPGEMPWPKGNLAWGMFRQTLLALCIAFVAATVTGYFLMKNLPKLPIGRRLALAAPEAVNAPPVVDVPLYEQIKPGSEGVLEGTCRPIGTVRVGDKLFDAMSEGDVIERGERVRVLRREGNTLVVERSPNLS